jgi:hypothetical protein
MTKIDHKVHWDFRWKLDKTMHFAWGASMAFLVQMMLLLVDYLSVNTTISLSGLWWVAVIIVSAMGVAKEIYDWYHPKIHTCDVGDFAYTLAGGIAWLIFISILAMYW